MDGDASRWSSSTTYLNDYLHRVYDQQLSISLCAVAIGQVMQPNMQGMVGMSYGGQMPPGAMPMQGGMPMGMQAQGMQFMAQPQFMGMRAPGPQYTADMQKQMAEEHQKRLEQQQRMLEEDRKRRQFEEQKQKLRMLSSVKPKMGGGEKCRDDALEAIKGNLDGFSRDAKMHPTPSAQTKKPGPSLEEKLFSSCDMSAEKHAHVSFKVAEMAPRAKVSAHYLPSTMARNWAAATEDLSSSLCCWGINRSGGSQIWKPKAGVGVYPQQEHIQPVVPGWLYNDSLIPELFKKVLEFTMTPAGVETAKLYPILMSSGLPREALGQIWAAANRTTPGMLTKEELYTVLALIGVAQSGLPAMNVEILNQFASPPVPNLPALAIAMAPGMPQHQQQMMAPPPISMAMPTAAPQVMGMTSAAPAPALPNPGFHASFPPVQAPKAEDDDFQDFQEAPKPGAGDQAFADFQGESQGPSFPASAATQHLNSVPPMLTPLSVEPPVEATPPPSDSGDKYSVFRQLEPPTDKKTVGEGFADFKSVSADDGFTDFKTADSVSPLDPPDQAKNFQPPFPPTFPTSHSLQQLQPQPPKLQAEPSPPLAAGPTTSLWGGAQRRGRRGGAARRGAEAVHQRAPQGLDKYDVFKQLSLEGGLAYDDAKDAYASLRADGDDFADFQSSKFCTALGASERSLGDKVAAFKQTKEDCASVKSLDLPSLGGSSVGKDDSEDALSVQLDMKLSDMGGDLKHVMSDSSLDLPGLAAHQPPAAEGDDMKFDPFGTSAGSVASYEWSDREEGVSVEARKAQASDGAALAPPPYGTGLAKFEAFADFGSGEQTGDNDDDFGDFAITVTDKSTCPATTDVEAGPEGPHGDKPKFGKSDFLKASSQAKVKSSEEMIKNELATFDLCVQGSHKRSHSLGEKEIGRSPPSPAPEQPFRDRSSTLNEKPALPIIRDKYKDLTGEVEESERYAYEWQRCLESVITNANNTLNGISSSSVCTEVIHSAQGMEYLLGVVEVYRVTRRVELGIKATAVCSEKLQNLLKDVSRVWNNLVSFMSLANLVPEESSLDFSCCILRHGIKNAKEINKEESTFGRLFKRAFNSETDNFKLLYGGHQYHASCANFWINCVEPKPPGLILPDLL
ncbi:hypothetical protein NHX12_008185 [Muraenolepis orangiensis]|uniref:EH domain-containing protein n=1 Tax=Muraenolepis orangiensis TaxID=630683 RepID=A0A9Q0IB11_9TELE|nr:hypothetical protein NHX12_008185 [Muraenolepis orangiensis]